MGITYEEIKANGNSVVVERQENLVIEQNSRNFFKHRQSLIKKKFARFSPSVAEKLIKRQETQEEIKRDGKSTNGACKAEKNADETGTETEAEVQLNNIIKEAVNTWVLKKKKSQQICDSVEKAYQQLCSLEHAINNEIEKLKQQRRVLRMGITSGLRLPERKNTYVQQNEDSSGKCDYSAKTLDEIIVEKFSNKHTSPHCQSEKIIASRPCTRTVSSQINSSKSTKTDRGALGDHKSLNKLIGKDYKDSKRSYELAEETSTDLKRNSQEKRLSNIKNFLTSPENMDLKDKKDQIVNICYGAAGGNGFCNNSISKPNNYTSKYYNASSRYDNNGVYNQSCYHENCFSSNGYGYTCTHNETCRNYPLISTQRNATTNTSVRYTPRINSYRTCTRRYPPSCARQRTDLDTENFCYRTGSSPCRPGSSSPSSKRVSNSSNKKENDLCTKHESAIKSKLQKDLRDHFQEARGRARAKVKGKHQTKDISDASCEEYVFFKKKECSEYCKDQERERDKMERKFCDESAEAFNQKLPQESCSNLSELLDRCAEEGIKWEERTKRDCINEKSAKREESTSSSSCTKVRSRRRICEITFTKRKPRTRSLSPIQTCTPCCLCPEYFMDETQCCEIPLSCHKRPEPEYSFETLCMLKKMKITEYKPSKPKNNGKDKQYNNYINKYEKEQEQESLRKQPSLSPKRNTLETTPNYNLSESPGYQSPVKSPPESKRISTRRSRNGESPIRTPAPTPSPVSTPPIRTPAPTPSPVPTPPIRTPAPTPPPVPTPPIRTSAPTPSSVFTPPNHTPTPAASPVPTAIFEPIPAHTSVSKPTPIPTPIPSPFLTPISTPIRRSVYEEPSPQRIEKLATPPTLSVIPAIASPKQPENFVASETSYHSTKSDDKDTESKVDQVIGRTTALEDLNTTKIRSKECIRIKECIAEDGTQITQIVRHLSIEEIFNPNNDQDNMESNNNNGTPTTSPSVQDLVAHLKNFLAAFQKQCVDVQCLQRLGATLVEALSKIDLCKGGDKVKIMKTIETQYIESEIYDVPNCMSTIPYAASTEITMENHQNVEDFPQCSRGDRENREVNLQTLSVHDENKFVDYCCEQDYSEDKPYDNWRAVDQRKKQLPHFPPPPPMTYTTYENENYRLPSCDTSSAYYEPISKTSPASQRNTIDCSTYSRRCRSQVNDISASLSPEDRNIMSLDIGNCGNTDMSSNSNYQGFQQKNRFLPQKQSILRRSDCSCTRSQSSSGLQSTSSSNNRDSFGALYGISACSCAGEKSHVKHDSKSSNSIYKDCTSNICPHTLQQRSVSPTQNNCLVVDRQIPITACSVPQISNLNSDDFLNTTCTRKHPNLLQCPYSASRHGTPCLHSATEKMFLEATPLRGILKCPTPDECKSRVTSYDDCGLSRNSNCFEAEQCVTVTNDGPQKKVQVGISYEDASVKDQQKILQQADRNAESIIYKDQNGRHIRRVFRTTMSESAVREPLNFCEDADFHASNGTCRLDDQVPSFTHCPCMYDAYKSMLEIYHKGKGKPVNSY